MKTWLWQTLMRMADRCEKSSDYFKGAANRLVPERALTLVDCEAQGWQNVRPCFVLSTGRSGTMFLNQLLMLSPRIMAHHHPRPELIRASKRAFEEIAVKPEIFQETFKSAREELIYKAAFRNQVYVETNNRITFFAPIIRDCFANAVFIHLVRHPGDFVRSGIRRHWYSGKSSHDPGRIVPLSGELQKKWQDLPLITKIGWLWNETNQFIQEFKNQVPEPDFLFIQAEELFQDYHLAEKIFSFLHVPTPHSKKIKEIMQKPVNVQKKGKYSHYNEWPDQHKVDLRNICPLARVYGYTL